MAWKEEGTGERLVKEEGGGHSGEGDLKSWGSGTRAPSAGSGN